MKSQTKFFALILVLALSSCQLFTGKKYEKGTVLVAPTKEAFEALNKEEGSDKRYYTTAYINYRNIGTIYTNRPQSVYLRTGPCGTGEDIGTVYMSYSAKSGNCVSFPENATEDKDAVITDNEGKKHSCSEKLMISFEFDKNGSQLAGVRIDKL